MNKKFFIYLFVVFMNFNILNAISIRFGAANGQRYQNEVFESVRILGNADEVIGILENYAGRENEIEEIHLDCNRLEVGSVIKIAKFIINKGSFTNLWILDFSNNPAFNNMANAQKCKEVIEGLFQAYPDLYYICVLHYDNRPQSDDVSALTRHYDAYRGLEKNDEQCLVYIPFGTMACRLINRSEIKKDKNLYRDLGKQTTYFLNYISSPVTNDEDISDEWYR